MKTASGLVKWCRDKLRCPYWYGTFGQTATQALLNAKKQQYPDHYKDGRIPTYQKQFGSQVFDCVGLIKGFVWSDPAARIVYQSNGLKDVSANGMRDTCCKVKGSMSTFLDVPGTLVFMAGHVGVYIGGGEVIEARGFDYGVVKTKLSSRPWKTWGMADFIDYTSADLNGDGKVDEKDLKLFAQIIDSGKPTKEQSIIADLDKDGKVTINDIRKLRIIAANSGLIIKQGDINLDGKITADEARRLLRIAAKLEKETTLDLLFGDMNEDGRLTAADARQVLRIIAQQA